MKLHMPELKLVWEDDFSTGAYPSLKNWNFQTGGHGWGNEELQFYTDRHDNEANAYIQNGRLVIEARKEDYANRLYTSARLNTKKSWTYGRFTVRAKLPSGIGTWPAIWMMPDVPLYGDWPNSGEIDIMEHLGRLKNTIYSSIHTEATNHTLDNHIISSTIVDTATTDFHDYTIDWTPDQITGYVDGKAYFLAEKPFSDTQNGGNAYWPFHHPFHLILNLAVGGTWPGKVDSSWNVQHFEIDYVRVYQYI